MFQETVQRVILHETKPQPKPLSPTSITRGYEKFAFPKVVRQLTDENVVVRKRCLVASRELLAAPECRVQCFECGLVGALLDCLAHEDVAIQKLAAQNFAYLCTDAAGCEILLEQRPPQTKNAIKALLDATKGGVVETELACFTSLLDAAKKEIVRAYLLGSQKSLSQLLDQSRDENAVKATAALRLLHTILKGRNNEEAIEFLIDMGAVDVLWTTLDSDDADVKQATAMLLAFLAVPYKGKELIISKGFITELVEMSGLGSTVETQYAASSCLMALVIANSGKSAINEEDHELLKGSLNNLLGSKEESIIMNALQIITAIAEHGAIRKSLQGFQKHLKHLADSSLPYYVKYHISQAVRQLSFTNLPHTTL